MANLKSIKSKIISYKKTGTVTHAMEAVSAVKMRKSQQRAFAARAYARAAIALPCAFRILAAETASIAFVTVPVFCTERIFVFICFKLAIHYWNKSGCVFLNFLSCNFNSSSV